MPDLTGKTAIVTGANSGIGNSAARELARHGATVIMACRNLGRGEAARKGILNAAPGASVEVLELDLAAMDSIRSFARTMLDRNTPIDLLINNAGRLVPSPRKTTYDGFELTFGGNHLGPFALTGLLLPAILTAPAARVVTVSSIAHKRATLDFNDLQNTKTYKPFGAYAESKLANLMFGLELERKFRRANTKASSMIVHPGLSTTGFINNGPGANNALVRGASNFVFLAIGQDANHGAFPTLFAATSPDAVGGTYYGPDGFREMKGHVTQVPPSAYAANEEYAQQLWDASVQLTGVEYEALQPALVSN